jgi:hypothetical protein
MPMHYIVRCTDTSVDMVGPFATEDAAAAWGHQNIEDPRWNVVQLAIPVVHIHVPA